MNRRSIWLWGLVCLLQLAAPLYLVWRWETALDAGVAYRFQAAPVDPFDAVRGRYVALGFAEQKGPIAAGASLTPGEPAYAKVVADEKGFAKIAAVAPHMPVERNGDWIRVTVVSQRNGMAFVRWPFTRYYMPEAAAPAAEEAYRRSDKKNTWAIVRVHNGDAVLETLVIDGVPVKELIRERK